jgi:DNA polymerase-3 subunit beta
MVDMKFTCERALLISAVSTAARAVSSKSTIPALEGLLIEAEGEVGITGFNLEMGIRTKLSARIEERGAAVLNNRLFSDILRKLPDQPVSISVDDHLMTTIRCGLSEFNIPATPAADFPEMPVVEKQKSFAIDGTELCDIISRTVFAVSQNENKPVHTGSLFEADSGNLTVVSVDGFRLALCKGKIDMTGNAEPFSFVVPGSALHEVSSIASGEEETVRVTLGARHILFETGEAVLISRLLEGEFINYKNAIPRGQKFRFLVKTKALTESVERVSIVISEKLKNPLRCVYGDGVVKLSCTAAMGRAYDECAIEGNGGDLEIGFNNRFLLDALRAVPDENVIMELGSSVSPCVMLPPEDGNYLFMVLPVRLRAGEG